MWTFFKKEKTIEPADNIYTTLDNELKRMHNLLLDQIRSTTDDDGNNSATLYSRIKTLQDKLIETLEKQPHSDYELRKLQDQIADLYLTGTETNDNT